MRNTSYADFSNKKARNMGLATFKSWEQMTTEEQENYQAFEKQQEALDTDRYAQDIKQRQKALREAHKNKQGGY